MLEDFEKIVGCPLGGTKPFFPSGHSPSIPRLSEVLGIPVTELREKEVNRNGVVFFPSMIDWIDLAAVDMFLAYYYRRESPMVSILADVYCTLDSSWEKKSTRVIYCFPALYVWMVSHFVMHNGMPTCPLEDFCMVPDKRKINWEELLASMTGSTICWSLRWEEMPNMLCRCEAFPNIPLMGTKGCIN